MLKLAITNHFHPSHHPTPSEFIGESLGNISWVRFIIRPMMIRRIPAGGGGGGLSAMWSASRPTAESPIYIYLFIRWTIGRVNHKQFNKTILNCEKCLSLPFSRNIPICIYCYVELEEVGNPCQRCGCEKGGYGGGSQHAISKLSIYQ